MIDKLTIQVTKTSTGMGEYVQVMSKDMVTLNIVVVAGEIEIRDDREVPPKAPKKRRGARGEDGG